MSFVGPFAIGPDLAGENLNARTRSELYGGAHPRQACLVARLGPFPEPAAGPLEANNHDSLNLEEPGIRKELVERIRREIAAGTYDTPEKWHAALDNLLGRLHQD